MWSTAGFSSPWQIAAFGKVPRMGDFLRAGAGIPAGEGLEQWIEQGLSFAETRRGPSWPSLYAGGATYAFVFRPPRSSNAQDTLVGVIRPSGDAVGRRFPLVIYAPVMPRTSVPWPHILPIALGDFLEAAGRLLFEADAVTGVADMQAALRRLPPAHLGSGDQTAREYDAWAASTPLSHAWNVVFGGAQALSAPRALHTISESVAPFRGEGSPATKLGLRMPLGPGGMAAAAFWLDTVRRLSRSPNEVRTCFWCFDGTSGSALLQLGETPASTLADLWAPDPNSEYLCDLSEPASVDVRRFLTRLPPTLAEVVQAPNALVRDFLDRLTL